MAVNLSNLQRKQQQQSNMFLIVILLFIFAVMIFEYQRILTESEQLAVELNQKPIDNVVRVAVSEKDLKQSQHAKRIYAQLTFPWNELLSALEEVKQQHKSVNYKAIKPDMNKAVLLITAQAPSTETMLSFMDSLIEQDYIKHVFIVNQHLTEQEQIEFTIKAGWAIDD